MIYRIRLTRSPWLFRQCSGVILILALSMGLPLSLRAHEVTLDRHWIADDVCSFECMLEGEPAAKAKIRISRPEGVVLVQDVLDEHGRFVWQPAVPGDVIVQVDAGLGHKAQRQFTTVALPGADPRSRSAAVAHDHDHTPAEVPDYDSSPNPAHENEHDQSSLRLSTPLKGFIGVTFILAAGALWVSWRNTQRLGKLERRSVDHESRG